MIRKRSAPTSARRIVFAGYSTPQLRNNLGDYRTISRFQLQVRPAISNSQTATVKDATPIN
jgi:hypothetical protein